MIFLSIIKTVFPNALFSSETDEVNTFMIKLKIDLDTWIYVFSPTQRNSQRIHISFKQFFGSFLHQGPT